jgi:hypothetical protein
MSKSAPERIVYMELFEGSTCASIDGGRVVVRVERKTGSHRVRLAIELNDGATVAKEDVSKPRLQSA